MKKYLFFIIATLCVASVTAYAISNSADEPCKSCKGRGWFECTMCDGSGWLDCPSCNGDGYIIRNDGRKETCASCKGKGQKAIKCGYCDKGKRECDACYGTGKQRYIGK